MFHPLRVTCNGVCLCKGGSPGHRCIGLCKGGGQIRTAGRGGGCRGIAACDGCRGTGSIPLAPCIFSSPLARCRRSGWRSWGWRRRWRLLHSRRGHTRRWRWRLMSALHEETVTLHEFIMSALHLLHRLGCLRPRVLVRVQGPCQPVPGVPEHVRGDARLLARWRLPPELGLV